MKKISIIVALSLLLLLVLSGCHEPDMTPPPICPVVNVDANGNEYIR